ncbi:MAG TPA: HEAT repeat domain-containing protein [Solirubrobacteraceae bacterium]|nr:HEAT repeat domain-containing protein [Solirubrobacteraceae bacterium]
MASDKEPELSSAQPEGAGAFALPRDFLTLPPKERREIVWSMARTRSRRRESLAETIQHANEDGEPAVIPALTVALEVDPDTLVKRHAAYGLACIPDQAVVPALRGALPSADRATKGHAILALGRLRAREAVPDLVLLLDDRYARMLVADALVEISDECALAPLRRAAARGSPFRRHRLRKRVSTLETALGDSPSR